jgi:hypothetical protein
VRQLPLVGPGQRRLQAREAASLDEGLDIASLRRRGSRRDYWVTARARRQASRAQHDDGKPDAEA